MTAPRALAGGMGMPPRDGEFEVQYVAEGGGLQRVPLDEAGRVRFEAVAPARGFVSYKGQRNDLRSRLRATTPYGIPILTEAGAGLAAYLDAERRVGRVTADTDARTLALTLIGTGHLLFAGELGALPDASAVREIVEAITVGAEPGIRP